MSSGREPKDKGKAVIVGGTADRPDISSGLTGIGVDDDAGDNASTPMLPTHSSIQRANSDPLIPVRDAPSLRLHADRTESM